MERHITDERTGISYTLHGNYYLPDLEYPSVEREIGAFGMRHMRYIEEHRSGFFSSLVLSGKLYDYLADIDEQANDSLLRLVDEMAEQEDVTEQLKEEDMMEWVRRMNSIREMASEIVNCEIIFG